MSKKTSNPFGLFGDYEKKSLQENLFHLLLLHSILLSRYAPLLPEDKQEEFNAARKLIGDQRKLYDKMARQQCEAEKRLADYNASKQK